MTRSEAAKLVAVLANAYPSARVTEETSEIYEAMLGDLDFASVQRAAARHIATNKWFPTIAELRAAAVEMACGRVRPALEAWGELCMAIRLEGGVYAERPPRFDDLILGDTVRQMGWQYLCKSENDAADRARFVQLYEEYSARARLDAVAGESLALPPVRRHGALPARGAEGPTPLADALGAVLNPSPRALPASAGKRRAS